MQVQSSERADRNRARLLPKPSFPNLFLGFYGKTTCSFLLLLGFQRFFYTEKKPPAFFTLQPTVAWLHYQSRPSDPLEWGLQDPPQTGCTKELREQILLGPSGRRGGT
jgi:hypothetical protein